MSAREPDRIASSRCVLRGAHAASRGVRSVRCSRRRARLHRSRPPRRRTDVGGRRARARHRARRPSRLVDRPGSGSAAQGRARGPAGRLSRGARPRPPAHPPLLISPCTRPISRGTGRADHGGACLHARRPGPTCGPGLRTRGGRQATASSDVRSLTLLWSTRIPGPFVVENVAFVMNRPFEDAGLARNTSSSAAA